MAEDNNKSEQQTDSEAEEKKRAKIRGYEKLISQLKKEREEIKDELDRDYRQARRYVRSNPEEGVLIAFAGGIALGYILGKLGSK